MAQSTQRILTNAHLHSVLDYSASLMCDTNEYVRTKMHFLHMKCIIFSCGNYGCLKPPIRRFLMSTFDESAKFTQKISYHKSPA